MSSQHAYPYEGRACTETKCEPFFIREWETMIVGALVVAVILYVGYSCYPEYFSGYAARGSTQRMLTVDDRPFKQISVPQEQFRAEHQDDQLYGTVLRGAHIPLKGVSTEKFTEFARIDAIDHLKPAENPTHIPETSDDDLVAIAY